MECSKNKKQNKSRRRRITESDDENITKKYESEPRVVLTPVKEKSRDSSGCSSSDDEAPKRNAAKGTKMSKRSVGADMDKSKFPEDASLEAVAQERKELERFLFEESNKINRPAIKFILEKWASMEARLQNVLVENKILKEGAKNVGKLQPEAPTYAQAAAMRTHAPRPSGPSTAAPEKRILPPKEKCEVVLIKPEKEDKRNNEEIKAAVLKGLSKVRKNLKVRSIRQMRKQGLVVEVMTQRDVEVIESCDLRKIGFVMERPKKIDPSAIIYGVEREYKEEDLKEDLVKKNLDISSESEAEEAKKLIKFVHSFKAKDERRVNWIIQLPPKYHKALTSKGRAFLMWRSYGIRNYVNVTKCYKCHGYGHIAKACSSQSQLCSFCGSDDHLRKDCRRKESPVCINCTRAKRKETGHVVHDQKCPEYMRHLDLYLNRIKCE